MLSLHDKKAQMKGIKIALTGFLVLFFFQISAQNVPPKREFRGVWVQVINQSRYMNMSAPEMKTYFRSMLNTFQACNINALIFQVRPTADAFYYSELEPWSRYLTGVQGLAPQENFDPMQFLIEECHKRGMEFHAWINPYRVTANANDVLCENHIYWKRPEWFVQYGGQIFFDPGLPQSQNYICQIVRDIVSRYDVDAIHMDDYFYPYPKAGESFPDDYSFLRYAGVQGFASHQRADWRRNNVNELIKQIKHSIVVTKPWVRFGISPFGIYRNKKNTPDGSGSGTNGLQNYDDLYADVLLWAKEGWIDYLLPQLYWEIGNKNADYQILNKWWAENKKGNGHLYIGQDISRTANVIDPINSSQSQLPRKMNLMRSYEQIDGLCWWYGYQIENNEFRIADNLKTNYHSAPALIPAYTHLHKKTPKDVKSLKAGWTKNGYVLHWKHNGKIDNPETGHYFVVYRFNNKEKINLNNPQKIVAVTGDTQYFLPYDKGKVKYKYVVTSVDRFHNESKKGKSKTVKL